MSEKNDNFIEDATEEDRLRYNIEMMEDGRINGAMLSTCEIYGLSGNCGEKCPKYQDRSCEYINFDDKEER